MKVSHATAAVLVSIVVFLAGNLLSAPYNSQAYHDLLAQKTRVIGNLEELRQNQAELQARIELLQRSADAIRVESRALGYYEAEETVVRNEFPQAATSFQSPGRIVRVTKPEGGRRRFSAIAAALAFPIVLAGLALGTAWSQRVSRRASR
jgi:cell division protein FtsB